VLGAGGPNASLDAVARAAGVGPGTLYRHFPTREALSEAVYRREVEHLVELSAQLANTSDPVVALRTWLAANVEFVATKRAWQRHERAARLHVRPADGCSAHADGSRGGRG